MKQIAFTNDPAGYWIEVVLTVPDARVDAGLSQDRLGPPKPVLGSMCIENKFDAHACALDVCASIYNLMHIGD